MGVMLVRFFLCARNLNLQAVERSSEIGPRQLINSRQRCINQQRVFLNFSLHPPPQRVVKGEQERDVFRELFSLGSENRGEQRAMPSAG